ncbi:MAG: preprotein translocase subunit SecA [bacterium]|nr:preprotein translocase subunit SecA [bacterium]
MASVLAKIFGTKYERDLKKIQPVVDDINSIYETLAELPEDEFLKRTETFRERIREDRREFLEEALPRYLDEPEEHIGSFMDSSLALWKDMIERRLSRDIETTERGVKAEQFAEDALKRKDVILDELLPEAFATVKEGARRLLGKEWLVTEHKKEWDMVHFDVQLIGGIALHQGNIAEMATGEGKTLVATLPFYLNGLTGDGCHLVTVNDYLALRDAEWMGDPQAAIPLSQRDPNVEGGLLNYLGISVGCIQSGISPKERREMYACDVTYGTNSEFGFDYLRDNGTAMSVAEQVQRGHSYAIIDEVDSVLIDEARTPLIISGPSRKDESHAYTTYKPLVERLVKKQSQLSAELLQDAQKYIDEDDYDDAIYNYFKVSKSTPKHKKLLKILEDAKIKKDVQRLEGEIMRDKKMHDVAEELYFSLDEKGHAVELSDLGRAVLSPHNPELFELPDISELLSDIDGDEEIEEEDKGKRREEARGEFESRNEQLHNISQLLRAYLLFEKDVSYVIKDNKVVIVDEFTGRLMPSRRYSDGLHQALEAKENVAIERETITLATITIQNYFRMYDKLSGMTGTADTEAGEFHEIYKLDVMVIPTNAPVRRVDYQDVIYRTKREKYAALIEEITENYEGGRPVLVGTVSVDTSELISRMLKGRKIPHEVLNAKNHQREAEIVKRAGEISSVTIATNMAGRGTDIKLTRDIVECKICALETRKGDPSPDDPELAKPCRADVPCGLHIVGTERHDSRRIDRQLRGRSGRQGDPGSSRFFLSLEDDLMRLFGSERITSVLNKMGMEEGEAIEHGMITKNIERAQQRVEENHFAMRKRVLDYDDVMNKQRAIIYELRNQILHGEELKDDILDIIYEQLSATVEDYCPPEIRPENWDFYGIADWLRSSYFIQIEAETLMEQESLDDLIEFVFGVIKEAYDAKEEAYGEELMRRIERYVMLSTLDENWQDHLTMMQDLREGIGLRAYGQRDPLVEYKKEAYDMFSELLQIIDEEIAGKIFRVHIGHTEKPGQRRVSVASKPEAERMAAEMDKPQEQYANTPEARTVKTVKRTGEKVGRNDPCPCGSGKKYKHCCGKKG